MFCSNCGKEIKGVGTFCTNCGARQQVVNQQTPHHQANVQQTSGDQHGAAPKKFITKKLLVLLIAVVVAVTLVVAGLGLLTGRSQNPVALVYDGIGGLLALDSFSFNFNGTVYGDNARCDGYIKFGKTVDDIVLYAKVSSTMNSGTVALHQGSIYFAEGRDTQTVSVSDILSQLRNQLDNEIASMERYRYYSADQIRTKRSQNQKLKEMLSIGYINNYLESGRIDSEKLLETMFSSLNDLNLSEDSPQKYFTPKAMKQALSLAEAFIHSGLENKDVLNKTLPYIDKRKNGGNTTYTFTVDSYNGLKEFFNYVSNNYAKYTDLNSAAEGLINDRQFADSIENTLNLTVLTVPAVIGVIRDLILGELSNAMREEMRFTVTADNKGLLQEFSFSYGRDANVSLEISDQNRVKPDENTLNALKSSARSVRSPSFW